MPQNYEISFTMSKFKSVLIVHLILSSQSLKMASSKSKYVAMFC